MEDKLIKYVDLLKRQSNLKEDFLYRKNQFELTNKELINQINNIGSKILETNMEIKEEATLLFKETGDKKLFGGISIREGINVIFEPAIAYEWALEHKMCLKLDETAFKKIAKMQDLEFVQTEEKITVCFPKEIVVD